MPTSAFQQHLEMIGLNEKVNKKANFWSSYVKALGGSVDIQARSKNETYKYIKADDSDEKTLRQRVTSAGYHYTPLSRNTYGHTPRKTGQSSIYNSISPK